MTTFTFANNINTTLAGAVSTSATTITLASTANLPSSIPTGEVLVITLNDAATRQNFEIVYATARTGATLTVLRAQEGTAALSWLTGDFAYSPPTAGQQASFGQISGSNTWTGSNSFSSPVAVAAATAIGDAVNLGQFLSNISASGYFTVPTMISGAPVELLVQYAPVSLVSSGSGLTSAAFTLPTPFTTGGMFAMASFGGTAPPNFGSPSAAIRSNSQVTISLQTNTAGSYAINYIAIGY